MDKAFREVREVKVGRRIEKDLQHTESKLCPEKEPGLNIFLGNGDSGKNLGDGL